jgi:predicted transcriptional regulator of viral defense system
MKAEELLSLFIESGMAVFTAKDVERLTGKGVDYTALYLNRLVKRRKITRIEKGKYCLINANIFEIAANVVYPSYISMLAAFELHGITEQKPLTIDIVTTKRHKSLKFNGYRLFFHTIKKEFFAGFYRMNNRKIICAEPEKAIADSIYFNTPDKNYVYEALNNGLKKKIINLKALQTYLENMKSVRTNSETMELKTLLEKKHVHFK